MADIPVEKLHEIFEYRDGELYWKERPESEFSTKNAWSIFNSRCVGKEAGYVKKNGYKRVHYKGISCLNHRIIFAMHHGYYPEFVDHIDNSRANNKIENLREATQSENQFNASIGKANTSGYKNIVWHSANNTWRVQIIKKGKRYGKYFAKDELDKAVEYAKELREKLHGDYARHE